MIYSMNYTSGKLEPVSGEGKNDLAIGTVLQLNGYNNPKSVITKNLGIDKRDQSYGSLYLVVNLDDYRQGQKHAYELEFLADKTSGKIQTYIMDEILSKEEVDKIIRLSNEKHEKEEQRKKEAERIYNEKLVKGKKIIDAIKPAWGKTVIVACKEIDNCDLMTDYFNTQTGKSYILAWSKHNRDIFSEMRKAVKNSKMPEIQHLATPPDIDRNGDKKTEENKSWWHPADEHREKYSMGAGYYLKASHRYDTDWKVEKITMSLERLYIAAAEGRYLVPAL
jgi:hypothetical protein